MGPHCYYVCSFLRKPSERKMREIGERFDRERVTREGEERWEAN